ncbi:ABC transporter permease subunit [bacterium]|nr:ABC transporter permease subunit [bacterium]
MLKHIVLKEVWENISSPKFVFTFLLCTVLIILSAYTGIGNYRADFKEYNSAKALNKQNLDASPSWQALAGLGTKITKPPQVLGTLAAGIQDAVGRNSTVNIAYDPQLVDSKYDSNPVFAIFGNLDLTLIVKIVLSLFAILFTYDAIVGEKERGTLKLALANRVPRDQIILGKAIGSFISLLVPLLIPFLLGLLMLNLYPDISLSGGDWSRIALMFLFYLLYLSVFFTLGLFVSSRTNRSSSSLFILLFIWVILIFVVPKSAVMVANHMSPIPSVHDINSQKDAFLQEIQGSAPQKVAEWREANEPVDGDDPTIFQEKFRAFLTELQQDLTARIDAKNAEVEESFQSKRRRQQMLALNLSRISPASSLTFGALALAKTGIHEHERFLNSIKTYKPIFTKWVNAKMMENLDFNARQQPKPVLDDMPLHEFVPMTLADSFALALPDFVVMILMIIVLFAGAFVSFLRYDIR